jgi:quinol monooxygenase YgiN
MIALIVVLVGAVAAAAGTGMLAARGSRQPRVYFAAWTVALFGLAIGLAATTLGYLAGFGSLTFRVMELGAQLIAPLSLCIALCEIVGRSLAARFAMRLAVAGLTVIALVVLGTDPINPDVTFSTKWPDPSIYYQIAPLVALGFITLLTTGTSLGALAIVLSRSSKEQWPREEKVSTLNVAAAAFFVVLPGLAWLAHKFLGIGPPLPDKDIFAACCVLAVGLTWYAARIAGNRDLSQAGAGAGSGRHADDEWLDDSLGLYRRADSPAYGAYETGEFDEYGSADMAGGSQRRHFDEPDSDIGYPGLAELAAGPAELDDRGPYSEPGEFPYTGQLDEVKYDGAEDYDLDRRREHHGDDPQAPLFGQITIYTLVEGRTGDFDRLTEWVVGQVRSKEPDTLVYIVHAVPTAPLQRILYEVYRDRNALEEHLSRGYVMRYQAEQRPFVLATNVIELGLQQAKVSPLPSISAISDILSESGIDLTGITGSGPSQYDRQQHYERPYRGWADNHGEDSRYR